MIIDTMFNVTDEEKLILLSSRPDPSKEDVGEIECIINNTSGEIDYRRLVDIASQNGVTPFLYKNLKTKTNIPTTVINELHNAYLCTLSRNLISVRETLRILHFLKDNGIEAIPLKGSIASEIIFKNPGLYASSDIDILVKPSELDEVKKVFLNNGFKYDEKRESDMLSSHYHLVFFNDKHVVDVHWNLVKRYFDIKPDFWWEEVSLIRYNSTEILTLSPERYIMYAIFRLFTHEFSPLRFFILVSEIINHYSNEIEWDKLLTSSEKYNMKRLITFALKMLNELLGTRVPNYIVTKRLCGYEVLKHTVIAGLFREPKRPHIRRVIYLFLLDTPFDVFKSLFKRFFPEKGELRLRYRIPEDSKKLYVYYMLNLFLLPRLILRKRINS